MKEIFGLTKLKKLELSYNQIVKLYGFGDHEDHKYSLGELRLEHNMLESLDGHLKGLKKLAILNVANNRLKVISPSDLMGMEELEHLDVSYNQLLTIQGISEVITILYNV